MAIEVRTWGDAFTDDEAATALRACLRGATARGWRCAPGLTAARGVAPTVVPRRDTRALPLTDGAHAFEVHTALSEDELAPVLHLAGREVAATAPVLVFAEPRQRADAMLLARLEHPMACGFLEWQPGTDPGEMLDRVAEVVRAAGTEDPEPHLSREEALPWLRLPRVSGSRLVVHPGSTDPGAGTDIAVRAHAAFLQERGFALRVVLPPGEMAESDRLRSLAARAASPGMEPDFDCVAGPLSPDHLRDAGVVLLPWRGPWDPEALLRSLASGRPAAVSRCAFTAPILSEPGLCRPIGGRWRRSPERPGWFEPDPVSLVHAVSSETDCGARARAHVLRHHLADRPARPAPPAVVRDDRSHRPCVVLEAPFLETSSAAELSIETARALLRRGRVDLYLTPVGPLRDGVGALRRRAPELVRHLVQPPSGADLWLSSGWPPRARRPDARRFMHRIDWEYGALPAHLCPLVTEEADGVVVHSRHVARTVAAAGRDPSTIHLVPHGVDGSVFHERAAPLREVVEFKAELPAVLFCGGLIWRKGCDHFVRALLSARARGVELCAVVKAVGSRSHYSGYHLGELLQRLQRTKGAPRLLLIDRDMERAELAGLYAGCDVLLHPYRGEGFGMPVLEARACGLPVLVTAGGSTDDFCDGEGVIRIPARRRELKLPEPCTDSPWVLEPDADSVTRSLLGALRRLSSLRAAATAAATAVREHHTWEKAAERIECLAVSSRDGKAAAASTDSTPLFTS